MSCPPSFSSPVYCYSFASLPVSWPWGLSVCLAGLAVPSQSLHNLEFSAFCFRFLPPLLLVFLYFFLSSLTGFFFLNFEFLYHSFFQVLTIPLRSWWDSWCYPEPLCTVEALIARTTNEIKPKHPFWKEPFLFCPACACITLATLLGSFCCSPLCAGMLVSVPLSTARDPWLLSRGVHEWNLVKC